MDTFTHLLKLIAPFKKWVALAVLLNFVTIGSSVGLIAMSAYLISKAALMVDVSELALAITSVRLFATLRAIFRYLERYFSHTATFRILTHLRVWFYSAIEPLAPARLLHFRSGDLLTRSVADIETLVHHFVLVSKGFTVPKGEIYVGCEVPKGELGFYIVSDGSEKPLRMKARFVLKPPSGLLFLGPWTRISGGTRRDLSGESLGSLRCS